jgi:endo-1,4-beta-xylanase
MMRDDISRRGAIRGVAALAAPLLGAAASAPPIGTEEPGPKRQTHPGLHYRALAKGLFYGAVIDPRTPRGDPALMAEIPTECGVVGSTASFSWAEVQPRPDVFSFDHAEMLMAFAARHALRVRGRALVDHRNNPPWLDARLAEAGAEKVLGTHIAAVAGHFRHRLMQWDVVNEAVEPGDGRSDGLRDTIWVKALGPRYIDLAFHAAASADPSALLVLNETGLDYAAPAEASRRQATLRLLATLTARGVPVKALGVQAHLHAARADLDQRAIADFLGSVAALGLKIVITEMDVRDNGLPADPSARDTAVAAHGRAYLDAVLGEPAVVGVCTWGLSDRRTPLNDEFPRQDGLPQRPLPLDRDLQRKPLWAAMARAFDTTPAQAYR